MSTTSQRRPRLMDGYLAGLAAMSSPGQGLASLRAEMAKSNEKRVDLMRRLYLSTSTRQKSTSASSRRASSRASSRREAG